jgi:hypothetical protein
MFQLYNWLFEQLEKVGDIWRAKAHRSKHAEELVQAINAARVKLAEYYGKTDGDTGTFYNLATILNPSTKLSLYENDQVWGPEYREQYLKDFHAYYNEHYKSLEAQVDDISESNNISTNSVTAILASTLAHNTSTRVEESEAVQYLRTPPLNILKQPDPLRCWKTLEPEYPTLARMARDVLAIPATEVGVERLFNVGRDTCHYRRNRLNGKTIEMIMVIKYFERIGIPLSEPGPPSLDLQPTISEEQSEQSLTLPPDEQQGEIADDICEWERESNNSDDDSESESEFSEDDD